MCPIICLEMFAPKKEQIQLKPSVFNYSVRGLNTALVPDNTGVLDKAMQPTTFPSVEVYKKKSIFGLEWPCHK